MNKNKLMCFYHVTQVANLESIIKLGRLMTPLERCAAGIDKTGAFSINHNPCNLVSGEYPGLYLNALFMSSAGQTLYAHGGIWIIYPTDILQQANWHFNIIDQNGLLNQNSFSKSTLHLMPNMKNVVKYYEKTNKYYPGNELVMHDGLPFALAKEIWISEFHDSTLITGLLAKHPHLSHIKVVHKKIYPRKPYTANKTQRQYLDVKSKPVFVSSLDFKYSGIKFPIFLTKKTQTSPEVYLQLAENAGIKVSMNKERLNNKIMSKLSTLFNERPDPKHFPPFLV